MISIAVISGLEHDRNDIIGILAKQEDFVIAASGADGYDALMLARKHRPDVIIIDFSMEEFICTDLAPVIQRMSPSTAIIVLCPREEQAAAGEILNAGISGFLIKQGDYGNLADSVRSVCHGGMYLSQAIRNQAAHMFLKPNSGRDREDMAYNSFFTFTELRIFFGILLGHTDSEIAKGLNMNTGSLRNCITRLKKKTKLHNRTQIAIVALSVAMMNHRSIQGQLGEIS